MALCKSCGLTPQKRPNGLCYKCWKAAGCPLSASGALVPDPEITSRTDDEPGIPTHLAAMRWVTEQDGKLDDTPLKKALRVQFHKNATKFLDDKQALEKAWLAESEPTPTAAPAEVVPAEAPFPELEEAWGKFQAYCRSNP